MEGTRSNIKSVVVVYIGMVLVFLFVYKGFIQSGEIYYKEYNEYLARNGEGGMTLSSFLKKKESSQNANGTYSKYKIPQELSNIDNTLLESKSVLEMINDKQERVITQIKEAFENYKGDEIKEVLNKSLGELIVIKGEYGKMVSYLDDIAENVDSLRKSKQ